MIIVKVRTNSVSVAQCYTNLFQENGKSCKPLIWTEFWAQWKEEGVYVLVLTNNGVWFRCLGRRSILTRSCRTIIMGCTSSTPPLSLEARRARIQHCRLHSGYMWGWISYNFWTFYILFLVIEYIIGINVFYTSMYLGLLYINLSHLLVFISINYYYIFGKKEEGSWKERAGRQKFEPICCAPSLLSLSLTCNKIGLLFSENWLIKF